MQWAAQCAGTGTDRAQDIDVDGTGNSYITGYYTSDPLTIYNTGGSTFGTLPMGVSLSAYYRKL